MIKCVFALLSFICWVQYISLWLQRFEIRLILLLLDYIYSGIATVGISRIGPDLPLQCWWWKKNKKRRSYFFLSLELASSANTAKMTTSLSHHSVWQSDMTWRLTSVTFIKKFTYKITFFPHGSDESRKCFFYLLRTAGVFSSANSSNFFWKSL